MRYDGGWLFVPAHLVAVILEVLFCASLVVVAYNLCLKWFGRERLDNLMTTVQVVVAVAVMAGAQIVPRILPQFDARAFAHPPLWLAALPPTWFGALDEVLTHGVESKGLVALAGFGVAVTVLMMWLGVSCLAATYAQGLATLNEAAPERAGGGDRGRWSDWLVHLPVMRWWLRDPVERASFRLTLANVTRARGVKLRLYPTLAQMVIYPVVLLVGSRGPGSEFMAPFTIAMGGAFIAVLPSTALEVLRIGEDHLATEVFRFAPMERPAALFHGARKAVLALLCVPGIVAVAVVELVWLRQPAFLLLLLPGAMALPLFSLIPAVGRGFVPFAQPVEVQSANAMRTVLMLISMLIGFALAGAAAAAWKFGWYAAFLAAEVVLVAALTWVCRRWLVKQGLPGAG
jgi:hypothetical protein